MSKSILQYHMLGLFFSIALLTGCERNSTELAFQSYHDRLASVLDVDTKPPPTTSMIPFPDVRELTLPNPDVRISLLNAYELRKCDLFHLIAERNSILGKVQDRTHQLQYELLLINGLNRCIAIFDNQSILDNNSALHTELVLLETLKQQQLPHHLWNMVVGGKEWRQQFSPVSVTFELNHFPGFVESQEAFRNIAGITTNILTKIPTSKQSIDALLYHQEQIHLFRYYGQLFYSMTRARDWLLATTALLEAQENTISCGLNRNQQKATYLRNVFFKFFAEPIQPYLAELDSQYQQLQPDLITAFSIISPPLDAFTPYHRTYIEGQLHASFRAATLKHVKFWQRTFKRCGIKLGN
ncbi:DUF3080 domain-containing protein [Photobacterium profundum]|uniref:DUF3080 domain-containing protein n=1 Tax=Photobacterium profundum (strain SS9) TaxID=298386 RepID=Q6LS29_PHOPR|nr:DUF3080 domain-containing protein [Photobacterium profundum]CAG19897.1 conserved hypothetical protein [Photobacterium profundum SS9]